MDYAALTVRHDPDHHRFVVDLDDSMALAEYTLPAGSIMFTHTEVPPRHEGHGVGTRLIEAGFAYAREHSLRVIPICPFFASYAKRHPEVQDLIDPAFR